MSWLPTLILVESVGNGIWDEARISVDVPLIILVAGILQSESAEDIRYAIPRQDRSG